MQRRNNKLINQAINDILDQFPMFGNGSTEQVIDVVIQEFRNLNNGFSEFVQDMSTAQIEAAALEYLQDVNFGNLEK